MAAGAAELLLDLPVDVCGEAASDSSVMPVLVGLGVDELSVAAARVGQVREWGHDASLEWHVLQYQVHRGVQAWMQQLNRFYRSEPAMHVFDNQAAGFEWIDTSTGSNYQIPPSSCGTCNPANPTWAAINNSRDKMNPPTRLPDNWPILIKPATTSAPCSTVRFADPP